MRVDLNLGSLDVNEEMLIVNRVEKTTKKHDISGHKYSLDKKNSKKNNSNNSSFGQLLKDEMKKTK